MKRIYYFKSKEFGNFKTYNEALFKRLVKRAAELRATFVCWSDLERKEVA